MSVSGNTINASIGTTTYRIELMNSNSTIPNNVIHDGAANSEGNYLQANSLADPASLQNNFIFGAPTCT